MLAVDQLVETERRYKARTEERLAAEPGFGGRRHLACRQPGAGPSAAGRLVAPTTPVAIAESGPPSADLIGLKRLFGLKHG